MQYNFIDTLQLMQRKLLRQEAKSNCGIVQLATQAIQSIFQYLRMITRQWRQIIDRKPSHIHRVISRSHLQTYTVEQSEVDHCNHTSSRVASRITKGIELLKVHIFHACFCLKFAPGC